MYRFWSGSAPLPATDCHVLRSDSVFPQVRIPHMTHSNLVIRSERLRRSEALSMKTTRTDSHSVYTEHMTSTQQGTAIDRLAAIRKDLGEGDFSAYAFLALGLLGSSAPDVLGFILDRADDAVEPMS